jgi:2-dehydropantoate 2-reductase
MAHQNRVGAGMILIVGAGAVGTTLAGYLMAAHQPVRLLIRDRYTAKCQSMPQLTVDNGAGSAPLMVPKPELTTRLDLSGVGYLMICVKYACLDEILSQLPSTLPHGLTLVSTLNGISAFRRMRERYPADRVANMTIMFNAQLLSPLHTQITTRPQVIIDRAHPKMLALFTGSNMQVSAADGQATAWGKLLINLANAVCAITHSTAKDLLTQRDMRAIYTAALDEAVGVIRHAGIAFQFPLPLPYRLYRQILLHGGPLSWWLAKTRNGLQAGSYPSMVADMEIGRRTEVDQINGEIVALGRARNWPAPINEEIVRLVRSLEGNRSPPYLRPAELRARLRV